MALLYHNKICISLYNLYKIIGKFNIDCLIFRPKTLLSLNLFFIKLICSTKIPVFLGRITVAGRFFLKFINANCTKNAQKKEPSYDGPDYMNI